MKKLVMAMFFLCLWAGTALAGGSGNYRDSGGCSEGCGTGGWILMAFIVLSIIITPRPTPKE